ncbi:protein kinase [Actinoallomurus sp. NPDC050550]|uniref:protein kinase domain-containing protein n=1 Tax=Actinoallomurus sp. NPDC050550 TaxID=3154937 RepID=UPI0033C3ED6C
MDSRFSPLGPGDPRMVASYPLHARLGAGGMGNVYLAFTPGGRAIAIKVVRPEFAADEEFRRRFRQEIAAAQRVQGLYTATVVDADADAPTPWMATAYVAGPSLQQAVAGQGPFAAPMVFRLTGAVAEALSTIHAARLIHRDLKPSNVLLASDGPRVIDFGIAWAADVTAVTRPGVRVGTPAFMSPEQVRGRPATPATDVFALGQLAVYAATGRPAFGEGLEAALLYRILNEPPDLDGCPPALRDLAARCLAKDPETRPDLAEIMEVARAESGDPTPDLAGSWLPDALAATLPAYDPVRPPEERPATPVPGAAGGRPAPFASPQPSAATPHASSPAAPHTSSPAAPAASSAVMPPASSPVTLHASPATLPVASPPPRRGMPTAAAVGIAAASVVLTAVVVGALASGSGHPGMSPTTARGPASGASVIGSGGSPAAAPTPAPTPGYSREFTDVRFTLPGGGCFSDGFDFDEEGPTVTTDVAGAAGMPLEYLGCGLGSPYIQVHSGEVAMVTGDLDGAACETAVTRQPASGGPSFSGLHQGAEMCFMNDDHVVLMKLVGRSASSYALTWKATGWSRPKSG